MASPLVRKRLIIGCSGLLRKSQALCLSRLTFFSDGSRLFRIGIHDKLKLSFSYLTQRINIFNVCIVPKQSQLVDYDGILLSTFFPHFNARKQIATDIHGSTLGNVLGIALNLLKQCSLGTVVCHKSKHCISQQQ